MAKGKGVSKSFGQSNAGAPKGPVGSPKAKLQGPAAAQYAIAKGGK